MALGARWPAALLSSHTRGARGTLPVNSRGSSTRRYFNRATFIVVGRAPPALRENHAHTKTGIFDKLQVENRSRATIVVREAGSASAGPSFPA